MSQPGLLLSYCTIVYNKSLMFKFQLFQLQPSTPISQEEGKEGIFTPFNSISQKFLLTLLLTSHCPERSHMAALSWKGGWKM